MGIVYLIGAGPGDAGLITVKGAEKLKECDAVVYDHLACVELLSTIRPDCKKIYVGKQAGHHSFQQGEINQILVECAQTCATVVRLKGGDPFVFGRGSEEIEALRQYNIPYAVIPGVTSACAVPESAGIPVTHRGVSRSFHVITGHTNTLSGEPVCNYRNLAESEGTLVFLMGLSHLQDIADGLMQAGKSPDTPVAVIADGTTDRQHTVRAPLGRIAQRVYESKLPSPAVIVVGATAAMQDVFLAEHIPKVGLTATQPLQTKLACGFARLGMRTEPVCTMQVRPTDSLYILDNELTRLGQYDWVVFTSQNTVRIFFEEMRKTQTDIRCLGSLHFAVLGSGTAAALRARGIRADFVPSNYTVAALATELTPVVGRSGQRVLLPRAVQGSPQLAAALRRTGVSCTEIPIYNVCGCPAAGAQHLDELDYLVFVSASGVRTFFAQMEQLGQQLPPHLHIACIGEVTRTALVQEHRNADIVAAENSVEGLLRAVGQYNIDIQGGMQHDTHEKTACK